MWLTRVPGLRWWGWEPSRPEGGKLSAEGSWLPGEQSGLAGEPQAEDICTSDASSRPTLGGRRRGRRAFNSWLRSARPLVVAGRLTPHTVPPQAKYKAREAALKAQSERKPGGEREERGKLPESPKRAEEIDLKVPRFLQKSKEPIFLSGTCGLPLCPAP